MKHATTLWAFVAVIFFIGFGAIGCEPTTEEAGDASEETTFDLTTAKEEIIAANKEFARLFAEGDSTGVANLYTDDAKFMMHGAPSIGRANIESTMSGFIGSGVTKVDLKTVEVWGTEEYVTEEGQLALYVGDSVVDRGKYIVLWKNVDGAWKLHRDIFNSDMAPE